MYVKGLGRRQTVYTEMLKGKIKGEKAEEVFIQHSRCLTLTSNPLKGDTGESTTWFLLQGWQICIESYLWECEIYFRNCFILNTDTKTNQTKIFKSRYAKAVFSYTFQTAIQIWSMQDRITRWGSNTSQNMSSTLQSGIKY